MQPLNPGIALIGMGKSSQRSQRQGSLRYGRDEVQVVQRAQEDEDA